MVSLVTPPRKIGILKTILGCILLGSMFVLFFSESTSPLYSLNLAVSSDSDIFQTIGKFWTEGAIPYVNLFDHKGPVIFFVDFLGYWLLGNRFGIFLIQICFMTATILSTLSFFRLQYNEKSAWILTCLSLLGLIKLNLCGNLTEEYNLPFLILSYYGMYKWLLFKTHHDHGEVSHPSTWAFLYGITFGIALGTRVTDAAGLCVGILWITIELLVNKKIKNLIENMIACTLGTLVIVLPFVIYFTAHDAFGEMIYATFTHNFLYAMERPWWIDSSLLRFIKIFIGFGMNYLIFHLAFIFLLIASVIAPEKNKNNYFFLSQALVLLVMFLRGRMYQHYCIICLPLFIVSLLELKRQGGENKKYFIKICCAFFVCLEIFFLGYVLYRRDGRTETSSALVEMIPKEELSSFIAWPEPRAIYLRYNIRPYYRFFVLQPSHAQFYAETGKDDIVTTFVKGDVRWILVRNGTEELIEKVLSERYELKGTEKIGEPEYSLYRRKD